MSYTGPTAQNEILGGHADMWRISIIKEIKEREYFRIMVHETKDMSKKEQMSPVVRYYYSHSAHECLLHFEATEPSDTATLSGKIIQILQNYGLDYKSNLVTFSHEPEARWGTSMH